MLDDVVCTDQAANIALDKHPSLILFRAVLDFIHIFPAFFNHISMRSEQIFIGKLDEDVMIPCSFERGLKVVIHWRNQDNSVYMYLKDSDHLEKQIPDTPTGYSSSTGNFRRSSLLDEVTYMCYVGTTFRQFTQWY